MKTAKQLERYFKGAANYHRVKILFLLQKSPDLTLDEISRKLDGNFKTISEHTKRLAHAGLLNKQYRGRAVAHSLSPYGKKFVRFMKTFK